MNNTTDNFQWFYTKKKSLKKLCQLKQGYSLYKIVSFWQLLDFNETENVI